QIVEETTEIEQGEPDKANQPILEEEAEVEETQAPVAEAEKEEPQEEEVVEEVQEEPQENPGSNYLDNFVNHDSTQDVVMECSLGGTPVFSRTLNELTSDHAGVDIEAEIGEEVKAALDGKIIKIYNDVKLGQTVVIEHSNNIETRYSNLEENVGV